MGDTERSGQFIALWQTNPTHLLTRTLLELEFPGSPQMHVFGLWQEDEEPGTFQTKPTHGECANQKVFGDNRNPSKCLYYVSDPLCVQQYCCYFCSKQLHCTKELQRETLNFVFSEVSIWSPAAWCFQSELKYTVALRGFFFPLSVLHQCTAVVDGALLGARRLFVDCCSLLSLLIN